MKPEVLVADYDYGDTEIERKIVEDAGMAFASAQCKNEQEVIDAARDANAILTQYAQVGAKAIQALPRLEVIARYGTGVDIVDVAEATRMGVQVTNAPNDWCADEVADHATALLLALIRKVGVYDRQTRSGIWHWNSGRPIHHIRGSILGLLSFGAIAHRIADRMAAFGAKIQTHDPFQSEDEIRARGAVPVSFDALLETSDYLVIQAPLTEQTTRLFGEREFKRMKPTALLVNTARGPIVEDQALYRALTECWIAGAALDDLEEEPAKRRDWKPDNPLFDLDNVLISPHAAYYSEESIALVRAIAAEEAVRVLRGEAPHYPVNRVFEVAGERRKLDEVFRKRKR
jgi:D-3-phosphoglycerate dehydrogenase / 2-oxoglutarate reductase